jgi:SulP family sulfate permease
VKILDELKQTGWGDLRAAIAVAFLGVPQAVAYAMIAGLPPKVGLYASTLPAVVGSLFRSSRHVISGPTNAVSLVVGAAVVLLVQQGQDPVVAAVTLAFMVGGLQLAAGLLRLGAVVDYISSPVVLGYITGAGVLIGIGQLPKLTQTVGDRGDLFTQLSAWVGGLELTEPGSLALGLGTAALMFGLRRLDKRIPGAIVVMVLGIALSWALGLSERGFQVVRDLSPIPPSLPPLTMPDWGAMDALVPVAVATTVLSLVESSSVARSIAATTGDKLDANKEFVGQGLANLVAGFTGGYPVSGSLSRSALNHAAGARTRLSGVLSGVFVLGLVLLLGPVLDLTPVASLAGLLLVVAWDLMNWARMRLTLKAGWGDALAFLGTLVGTWALELDKAIYLGVFISVAMFLRRASLLAVSEIAVDERGRLREVKPDPRRSYRRNERVRLLHVEGSLFFGAAGELRSALEDAMAPPELRVLVVRVKRARALDVTAAAVLMDAARTLQGQGRHLILVGMREGMMARLVAMGAVEVFGRDNLFPSQELWFGAMDRAIERGLDLAEEDGPLRDYLRARASGASSRRSGG